MKEIASVILNIDSDSYQLSAGYFSLEHVFPTKFMACDEIYRWLFVLQGKGRAIDEDNKIEYELKPGALFYRCPGCYYSITRDEFKQWLEFFISMPETLYIKLMSLGVIDNRVKFCLPGMGKDLQNSMSRLFNTIKKNRSNVSIFSSLFSLMSLVQDKTAGVAVGANGNPEIAQALDIIADNPKITLNELAARIGLCPDYFSRIFTREIGVTPKKYLIGRRLDVAQTLLLETDLSIEVIAHNLGYPDRFTFSRQFRKYIGKPPAAFRNSTSLYD